MTVIACVNQFELRLVREGPEIDAAQALRYAVFYEELGARATPAMRSARRDYDPFDTLADHLVVVDLEHAGGPAAPVVGCYRLLRESVVGSRDRFYTAGEFDLAGVAPPYGEILELGRSCVHADYRSGAVMQLLWRGIVHYLETHRLGLMLGCASLPGTDPGALAPLLGYLHHRHLAPPEYRPRAVPHRRVAADRLPPDRIDERQVLRDMPPLLKGYLRVGGSIGDGAVIDDQFNTTDVCLVLATPTLRERAPRLFRPLGAPVPAAAATAAVEATA